MRGRKPFAAIVMAKKFAERQGYRWLPNPDKDIPFDAVAYRGNDAIVIRVRTFRNAPGEDDMNDDFFQDDYTILRSLPFPLYLPRELWVRYAWSRNFHRFRLVSGFMTEVTMIDREGPVFPYHHREDTPPTEMPADRRDEGK